MDASAFDRLAKTVAAADSRRTLLRRVLAVLPLAGALAVVEEESSEAGRRHKRKQGRHDAGQDQDRRQRRRKNHHKPNTKRKKRAASPPPPTGTDCGACPTGTAGFLTAPDGAMRCAAGDSPACACLGVFRACAPGTECRQMTSGTVLCDWPPSCDSTSCADGCCDGTTCRRDDDGACGRDGSPCRIAPACPSATPSCCGGACVDHQTDTTHCGTCGNTCGGNKVCCQGACVALCGAGKHLNSTTCQCECPGGETDCGGACVTLQSDNRNCGDCGRVCGIGKVCRFGQCLCSTSCPDGQDQDPQTCTCTCPSGQTDCSGTCVDLQTDAQHCGSCSTDCTALPHATHSTCSAGACAVVCDSGYATCNSNPNDGCETHTATDQTNCGACGTTCSGTTPVCTNGTCVCSGTSCGSGQLCCNDVCVANDTTNCGTCGTTCDPSGPTPACNGTACVCTTTSCPSGQICQGGACTPVTNQCLVECPSQDAVGHAFCAGLPGPCKVCRFMRDSITFVCAEI